MISNIIYNFLKPFLGKKKYQKHFEYLNELALRGMNIGSGGDTSTSGEEIVLKQLKELFTSQPDYILFDVGANIGKYSLLLNDIFGFKSKIYSFEPSASTFELLKKNTEGVDNIQLYNYGLSDEEGCATLFSNGEGSGLASLYNRNLEHFNINLTKTEEIKLLTLDSFCLRNNISKIDLLKLDVEGNEMKILNGGVNAINDGIIKNIQFEFGGCNIDSRTFFQDFYYLLNSRFKLYRIVKDGLFEIVNYQEKYETFATTNYMAIRR